MAAYLLFPTGDDHLRFFSLPQTDLIQPGVINIINVGYRRMLRWLQYPVGLYMAERTGAPVALGPLSDQLDAAGPAHWCNDLCLACL